MQLVTFHAPTDAVQCFLPEPLVASPDGLCVAAGLDVGFCTSYGRFQEAFLLLQCIFGDCTGYFCSHVFHNGPAGIAAGREIYGTPKVYAEVAIHRRKCSMVTEARLRGMSMMRITSISDEMVTVDSLDP